MCADVVYMCLLCLMLLGQKEGGVSTQYELERTLTDYVNNAHGGRTTPSGDEVPAFEEITTMEGERKRCAPLITVAGYAPEPPFSQPPPTVDPFPRCLLISRRVDAQSLGTGTSMGSCRIWPQATAGASFSTPTTS